MSVYRGAFHLHSHYSYDSRIPLEEMAALLKNKGFSFAFMSEHAYSRNEKRFLSEGEFRNFIQDCRSFSSPDFLLIPGIEFGCYDNKVHILATPFYEAFSLEGMDDASKILSVVQSRRALAVLVHPFYNQAYDRLTPKEQEGLDGFEVWNYNYQHFRGPSLGQYWAQQSWFKRSPKFRAFAGLDLHQPEKVEAMGLEMELKELRADLIFQTIREGNYRLRALGRNFDSRGRITSSLAAHLVKREWGRFLEITRRVPRIQKQA